MRLEHIELSDDVVSRAEQRSGDWTWSETIEAALAWWLWSLDDEDRAREAEPGPPLEAA